MTTRSSEGLDERRRRLLFRSWHSGLREADMILGRFADTHVAILSDAELDDYERLLEVPTRMLVSWVMGEVAPPPEFDSPLYKRLCAYYALPNKT